jgi:hypothetical protein
VGRGRNDPNIAYTYEYNKKRKEAERGEETRYNLKITLPVTYFLQVHPIF